MGSRPLSVVLARTFYGIAVAAALILAVGVVAPAMTGAPGGCQVVLSIGVPSLSGPADVGPAPAPTPGSTGSGVPSGCTQYVNIVLPLVAIVLAAILLLTTMRLGGEPATWGVSVAVGAIAGIVATLGAAFEIIAISSSDQPGSSPGLGVLLIALIPVVVALASAFAIWRAQERPLGATA
jgi:hypothetical protein